MDIDVKPVLDPLREIESRGYNRYNVFRDWVSLMLYALQRKDDPYLDILEDYDRGRDRDRGNRTPDLFSEAYGELMQLMQETNQEVLGVAYEAFGMDNDAFGQHFTPHSACDMMAEVLMDSGDPDPPITIADPTCGSGRMLVHAARQTDEHTICFGQDKDDLCAEMTALNFCFFNMNGVVVLGDTLRVESRRAWRTKNTALGGEVAEVDPEDVVWPEAAFETNADADDDEPAGEERVSVGADGGSLDQAELGEWSG